MDKDKMKERLLKTSVWMKSYSFYTRMKAEIMQVFIRMQLLEFEINSPSRAYTKKELSLLRKQHVAMSYYYDVLLKRFCNMCPDFDLLKVMSELDEVELC